MFRPEIALSEASKCDVPGIFITDRAEVWRLSDAIVT